MGVMALRGAVLASAVLLAAGCSDLTTIDNGPTRITLTVDRANAAVGEEFEFSFSGNGSSITAVQIDFGDGDFTRVDAFGAMTVSGRRRHAFAGAGSYTVTATLEDAITGNVTDDVTVQVTAAAETS